MPLTPMKCFFLRLSALFFCCFFSSLFGEEKPISNLIFYSENISLFEARQRFFSLEKEKQSTFDQQILSLDLLIPRKTSFFREMACFLGKNMDKETLEKMRRKVLDYYKARGYPVVYVAFPKEQLFKKNLYVLVIVGKIGEIKITDPRYFSAEKMCSYLSVKKGDLIEEDTLLRELFWLNKHPFRSTDLILEAGEHLGETNLVFETSDRFPLEIYGGYNSSSYNFGGSNRYFAGVKAARLFFYDDFLLYEWRSSEKIRVLQTHRLDYSCPVFWKHMLKLSAYYTETEPTNEVDESDPEAEQDVTVKGKNWFAEAFYCAPIALFPSTFSHGYFGYQFRRTNNFVSFAEELVFDRFIDISQFVFGIDTTLQGGGTFQFFDLRLIYSPGKMTPYNRDSFFSEERKEASSKYAYGKFHYVGEQNIYRGFSLYAEAAAQYSSRPLVPSEEFSLGGQQSVRGYLENMVIGDIGVFSKQELRTPNFSPLSLASRKKDLDSLRFLFFFDMGWLTDADENIFEGRRAFLASLGGGLRYQIAHYVHASVDYGVQIEKINRIFDPDNDTSRVHVNVVIAY